MKKRKKSNDTAVMNSILIRRPIKRMFPLFVLPTFAAFCIGFLYPFLNGIYLSFHSYMLPSDAQWVGFSNYVKAFSDPSFGNAFVFTAKFTVISVVLINVVAFAIAYALTQSLKGSNLFRTVFFMPNLIGGVVLGYIWKMIFDGILYYFSMQLQLETTISFWALQILVAWQQIGYMMIIYIAGLQAIPGEYLEAARVDGATKWQSLIHVTIPNVMASVTVCTFLTLTNSFKLYDQNMALTNGYPIYMVDGEQIKTTEMLAMNIKSTYDINASWHGVAQAKAVIFFIMVAIIALLQLRLTRSKEVQQ